MVYLTLLVLGAIAAIGWRVYKDHLESKTWWRQTKIKETEEDSFDSEH